MGPQWEDEKLLINAMGVEQLFKTKDQKIEIHKIQTT